MPFGILEFELDLAVRHHFRTAHQRRATPCVIEQRRELIPLETQIHVPIVGGRRARDGRFHAPEHQLRVVATQNAALERGNVGGRIHGKTEDLAIPSHAALDIYDAQNGNNGGKSNHRTSIPHHDEKCQPRNTTLAT